MPKPSIRLPEDDDHGPNPYDSKTKPQDLPGNQWLVSWKWWVGALAAAGLWMLSQWWQGNL